MGMCRSARLKLLGIIEATATPNPIVPIHSAGVESESGIRMARLATAPARSSWSMAFGERGAGPGDRDDAPDHQARPRTPR